jgi:hypothetical protein
LTPYRWRRRLLLLCAPDGNDPTLCEQRHLIDERTPASEERDLLVFELFETSGRAGERELPATTVARLREHYAVDDAFTLLLIGKDGTVKRRETAPVPPDDLFAQIDRMPMRRREMNSGEA